MTRLVISFLIAISCLFLAGETALVRESCFSPVYCHGDLLHTVQTAKIFNDSKTFVDLSMIYSINETLENFEEFMILTKNSPTTTDIYNFVYENFESIGEIEEYWPIDYKPFPSLLNDIEDVVVRKFTENLIAIWPTLARKVSRPVLEQPQSYSIIPMEHGFIIPGGRFKEIYYWDSYWIIHGLLISEMRETAKGIVLNLLSLVERYGFVPNGTRVYYLNRSQPPLLTLMVAIYVQYTRNYQFLEEHIGTLEKELQFWLTQRTAVVEIEGGSTYRLAHYDTSSDTPRPESYIEDIETCEIFTTEDERKECYMELKAGAESGWDFTSRWLFDKQGSPLGNLSSIQTRRNLPVDLNGFLYKAFFTMFKMYSKLRDNAKAKKWLDIAYEWRDGIEALLWNEEDGIWYDYDRKLKKQRKFFYSSNITPLWARAMDEKVLKDRGNRAAMYLKTQGIFDFHGGIPTSFVTSGQQWDYPNAWSPIQGITVFALEESEDPFAKEVARDLAKTWVRSNIKAFNENRVMFEKYLAPNSGQYGGGGEYNVQSGFGWSNGVMLEFINHYYRIKSRKSKHHQVISEDKLI